MPRVYHCKKCGESHEPPTGKQCKLRENDKEAPAELPRNIVTLLTDISGKVTDITDRVRTIENERREEKARHSNNNTTNSPEILEVQEGLVTSTSPQTLREDARLMRQAANRLAHLQLDDSDDEDFGVFRNSRYHGKKSGAEMTATDKVEKRIDWPHWYVRRLVGGKRKPLTFSELRIEEFVFGFLDMLDSPKCKWDYRMMTQILKHMMRDTMDFSCTNARSFYEMAGLEIEKGGIDWTDKETIRDLCMQYARAVMQPKVETKEPQRATHQPAPIDTKTCPAYQKGTCEHDKDHPPLTHACNYCNYLQVSAVSARRELLFQKNQWLKKWEAEGTVKFPQPIVNDAVGDVGVIAAPAVHHDPVDTQGKNNKQVHCDIVATGDLHGELDGPEQCFNVTLRDIFN